jgi:MFS family permease
MLYCGIFYGIYMASVYKTVAEDSLLDHELTLAGALGSACNGLSRVMWAALMDKYGFKKVYLVLMLI